MKKSVKLTVLGLFASSVIGCGYSAGIQPMMMQQMATDQTQAYQAQSITGIWKTIDQGVEQAFKEKDKNGDNFITSDEFPVKTPDEFIEFKKLAGSDGKISLKEMQPSFLSKVKDEVLIKATAAFLFDQVDKNDNNKLTAEELKASDVPHISDNFAKYDTKKKGYLTKSEFEDLYTYTVLVVNKAPATTTTTPATTTTTPATAPKK
jgi:Ca2+-binding EF-hand superfamily protein